MSRERRPIRVNGVQLIALIRDRLGNIDLIAIAGSRNGIDARGGVIWKGEGLGVGEFASGVVGTEDVSAALKSHLPSFLRRVLPAIGACPNEEVLASGLGDG